MSYVKQDEGGGGGDTYNLLANQDGSDVNLNLDAAAGADSQVKFKAGSNITLTEAGTNSISIDATGGGTPGGANTQIQFNDGGSFGGDSDFTFDKTAGSEKVILSASSDQELMRITQTGTGKAFVIEDTTNPDPSRFEVNNLGQTAVQGTAGTNNAALYVGGTISAGSRIRASDGLVGNPGYGFNSDTNTGMFRPGTDTLAFTTGGSERVRVGSSGQIGLGGANYGVAGEVLTSNGPSSAPTWQAGGGGGSALPQYGDMSGLFPTAYPYVHTAALPPLSANNHNQSVGVLSDDIQFAPILFTSDTTIGKLWMRNGGTTNPFEIGIYETDSNNLPTNKVVSATIASPASNSTVTVNISSTTLTGGEWYWMAVCNTTTGANVTFLNSTGTPSFISTGTSTNRSTLAITTGTINALPASITQSDLIPLSYPPIVGVWTL